MTQAHDLRDTNRGLLALQTVIGRVVPSTSVYRAWKTDVKDSPGWVWVDELCAPYSKRPMQPNRRVSAAINPGFVESRNSPAVDQLLSPDLFASSTDVDPDFARLVDRHSWRERVEQAAASTLYCLCSKCETAAARGEPVRHTCDDETVV